MRNIPIIEAGCFSSPLIQYSLNHSKVENLKIIVGDAVLENA